MKSLMKLWIACILAAGATTALAGSVTDNFNTSRDYLSQGVAGTIWDGVYLGAGEFTNVGIAGVPGRTLKCDANITGAGMLTVQTTETAWEFTDDDGFFLYKVVSGDFQAVVHIITPYDNVGYNTAGLMARAFTGAGEPLAGGENNVSFTRFNEFGFANYGRSTLNNDTTQVNPGDPEGADLYWLMLERVGDTFTCYQKTAESDPWIPAPSCSFSRPDLAGMPVQVGIMHATFSSASPVVQFNKFSLTNANVGATPPAAATGLALTDAGSGSINLSWTPGASTAGSVVVMRPDLPITRQPTDGVAYTGAASFGKGDTLGGTNFVVYAGSGSSVTVTGLTASVAYNVAVYSYSGSGASIRYNAASPAVGTRTASGALTGIALTFATNSVAVDDTLQAIVTATFEGGGTLNVEGSATYGSQNTAVAPVAAGGMVSGLAVGSSTIVASYGGFNSTNAVTVIKLPVSDDFSVPRDYLAQGIVGTPWQGLLLGAADMPTGGSIGGNPGRTLIADAGITKPGRFTVKTLATDWEVANDDGFFLYRMVAGNFKVQIQRPFFEPIAYNWPGLMARAPFELTSSENYVSLTGFDQFGIGNYVRSTAGGVTANGPFTAVPAKQFIMLERKTNTFYFYEKAHALEDWTLITTIERPELDNVALQVGIVQACFSDNTPVTEFANFSIETTNAVTGAPEAPANLSLTRSGIGAIKVQWTPGTGSAGSVVVAHALTGLTRQPLQGVNYALNDDLGVTNIVVYAGSGTSVTVPNLSPVLYYFAVYSYADVNSSRVYNLNAAAGSLEALGMPSVTANPVSIALYPGRTARLSATAVGTSPLQYQWQKGGVDLVDGGNISGATTPNLTISSVTAADAGSYTLTVRNEAGGASSTAAALSVVTPTGSTYEGSIMSYAPVAYWRFSEPAAATQALDYWGGFNGAYNATTTLGLAGPRPSDGINLFEATNTCVQLDGTAAAAPVTTPALNINGNSVTMMCWVNPPISPNADRAGLFTCTGANTPGAGFRYATGGVYLGCLWNNAAVNSLLAIPANEWSFAAVAVSPTNVAIYLGNASGGLQSTNFPGSYPVQGFDGTGLIGIDRNIAGRAYGGLLDEMAIFNQTLGPADIANIYAGVQNQPKPSLTIVLNGGNIVISWPEAASGFTLMAAPTLGTGVSWTAVPGNPVPVNGFNTMTIATDQQAFYRLQK